MVDPVGTDAETVARAFNDRINSQDLDGLTRLMADDHSFIDSGGTVLSGKQACREAWRGFFAAFPDYRNVFSSITTSGEVVTIAGHSTCSEPELAGPAWWTATVREGKVLVWRVSVDPPEPPASL